MSFSALWFFRSFEFRHFENSVLWISAFRSKILKCIWEVPEKNYSETHKMDYMLFAYVLKEFFWELINKLKQTKLYQELKIVINLEKSDLGS